MAKATAKNAGAAKMPWRMLDTVLCFMVQMFRFAYCNAKVILLVT
jgi:hypothetical protein